MTTVEDLLKLDLFDELDGSTLTLFLSHTKEQTFRPGEILHKEGTRDNGLHLIIEGSATVTKKLSHESHDTKTVARLEQGEFLGEMSLINDLPASATVTALTEVKTLHLAREAMRTLRKNNPSEALDLTLIILAGTSHRLRGTTNAYVAVYKLSLVLAKTPNLEEILDAIFNLYESYLAPGTTVAFYRWNPYNEEYVPGRQNGPDAASFSRPLETPTNFLTQLNPGLLSIESLSPKYRESLSLGAGHLVLARADASGHREGLFIIYHPRSGIFSNAEKTLVETITALSALALADVRTREEEEAKERYLRTKLGSVET